MANALEAASLVMIPSGYEDGTLGSLKPTDGSGDFTFSRGSNLSATRINEQGYIEKGYENLLLQSNSFLTTWATSSASVTGGQAGYDGSSDAWKIESISDGVNRRLFQSLSSSGVQTYSVYAKAGSVDFILLQATGGAGQFFNLSTGTKGNTYGAVPIESKIELVGNGWYRCSITFSGSITQVWIAQSNGTTTTAAGDNIYIQDAMLNQGLVAYPYIETTTAPVAGGILEDEPRIDFSDGCGHLLLEPSRTNAVTLSEYIIGMSSLGGNISTLSWDSSIVNPEGYNGVTSYTLNNYVRKSNILTGLSIGDKISYSIFAKSGSNASLIFGGQFGEENAAFNVNTGTLVAQGANCDSYDIIDYGNGWRRYVVNITYQNSISNGLSYAYFQWTSNTESVYLWGWQVEQDATYPTSYIPTYGVSQTRLEDSATNTGTIDADNDFTFYFECDKIPDTAGRYINFTGALGYLSSYSGSRIRWRYLNSNLPAPLNEGVFKWLIRKDSTSIKMYLNGELKYTKEIPSGLINFDLEEGSVHKTLYFPTALSDSECIALTTI